MQVEVALAGGVEGPAAEQTQEHGTLEQPPGAPKVSLCCTRHVLASVYGLPVGWGPRVCSQTGYCRLAGRMWPQGAPVACAAVEARLADFLSCLELQIFH
jgi:hypothetical protein